MTGHFMTEIRNTLEERKNYLETLEASTKARLLKAPPGMLRVSRSRGRTQYYHRMTASDRKGVYIPGAHADLAAKLAQKSYDEKLLRTLQKEIKAIDAYIRLSPEEQPEEIYESLSETRKKMVDPPIETGDMFLDRWIRKPYEGKPFPDDYPELLTDKGERVRSKSELIIANMLAKENVPYRYEYPIRLTGFGTVYPDFTVLNIRERKEMYWEHQGMMDDAEYAEKAIRKVTMYHLNGIFPGDRLILTSETRTNPLNIRQIRGIIRHFLI